MLLFVLRTMGLNGLEPSTSRLSGVRSNQLSYKPIRLILFNRLIIHFSVKIPWRPPTFPVRLQTSIIGRLRLNRRVRDGNGCFPQPHCHQKFASLQKLNSETISTLALRKEVIQPHLPIRLPCYDFTPVTDPAFGSSFLAVRPLTSGITSSHGVTGGVYKTRERIHRDILIRDY